MIETLLILLILAVVSKDTSSSNRDVLQNIKYQLEQIASSLRKMSDKE